MFQNLRDHLDILTEKDFDIRLKIVIIRIMKKKLYVNEMFLSKVHNKIY